MKLGPGIAYKVRNLATNEHTYFHSVEINKYLGCYLCFGYATAHDVRVIRGVQEVKERMSSFVLMPDQPKSLVGIFTRQLLGYPMILVSQEGDVLFMVNRATCKDTLCKGCVRWHGPLTTQDEHMQKCVETVNLYFRLKERGEIKGVQPSRAGRRNGHLWTPGAAKG